MDAQERLTQLVAATRQQRELRDLERQLQFRNAEEAEHERQLKEQHRKDVEDTLKTLREGRFRYVPRNQRRVELEAIPEETSSSSEQEEEEEAPEFERRLMARRQEFFGQQ